MELLFAQVREDTELEIDLLNEIRTDKPLRIACVASGGCLLLNILSAGYSHSSVVIDVVDINPIKIETSQKKLETICQHSSMEARRLLADLNQSGAFEKLFVAAINSVEIQES